MPTLQELLEIAMRYATAMSDAMILACYECAYESGIKLQAPKRPHGWRTKGERPRHEPDYERMVRGNTDTSAMHC